MIKKITIDELPELIHLADKFYSCSDFLHSFNSEIWIKNWTAFIKTDIGVIFGLFGEDKKYHGAIGAIKFPDINGGFLIATETFWFTEESYKGKGIYLLKEYEKWAKFNKCNRIAMCYLADSMPDKVRNIYEKCGYKLSEVTYIKDII